MFKIGDKVYIDKGFGASRHEGIWTVVSCDGQCYVVQNESGKKLSIHRIRLKKVS
jgi:hypothetical protein